LVSALNIDDSSCNWTYTNAGISGYNVAEYSAVVDSVVAGISSYQYYALINLGVNDMGSMPNETTWKANYQTIIDSVKTKWPSIKIYLAKPWGQGWDTEANTMAGWIDDLVTANAGVAYVGIDERGWLKTCVATCSYDGIHYTDPIGTNAAAGEWKTILGY